MKTQNRVSQLTLELYHRGLATRKERKRVEKALLADVSVRERYEGLKESEREINQLVTKELARMNIPAAPIAKAVHSVNIIWGLIAAAAVLICALVPVFLHFKSNSPNKNNAITEVSTEETTRETDTQETVVTEDIPIKDNGATSSHKKTVITESPRNEPAKNAKEEEFKPESGKYIVSIAPDTETDTGVRLRGGSDGQQNDAAAQSRQEADTGIPPGITKIFENMFADRIMVGIVIPDRIRTIAKNAYAGNPVLVVNIGANVDVHDEAIPGNFARAYNKHGRAAGIYRRMNSESEEWEKL